MSVTPDSVTQPPLHGDKQLIAAADDLMAQMGAVWNLIYCGHQGTARAGLYHIAENCKALADRINDEVPDV